jgi:hypothetical protein
LEGELGDEDAANEVFVASVGISLALEVVDFGTEDKTGVAKEVSLGAEDALSAYVVGIANSDLTKDSWGRRRKEDLLLELGSCSAVALGVVFAGDVGFDVDC